MRTTENNCFMRKTENNGDARIDSGGRFQTDVADAMKAWWPTFGD